MQLILYIFLGSVVLQIAYYVFIYSRLLFHKSDKEEGEGLEAVSIVICARNEDDNLRNNLPLILKQDYPDFEVIVINDHSTDQSELVLKELSAAYPNLLYFNNEDPADRLMGKRSALKFGISKASNDKLLLTDADCYPAGKSWLKLMMAGFDKNIQVVLGCSPHIKKEGILNELIRFETFFTALQYTSYCVIGMPYMGVGRNLAYKKQLYVTNDGWKGPQNLLSGDDDLFLNRVMKAGEVAIQIDKRAHTYSEAPGSWSAWIAQKQRHLSSGRFYKLNHLLLLTLYPFTNIVLILSFLALLLSFELPIVVLSSLIVVLTLKIVVLRKSSKLLGAGDLSSKTVLYDIFYSFILPILAIASLRRPRLWK